MVSNVINGNEECLLNQFVGCSGIRTRLGPRCRVRWLLLTVRLMSRRPRVCAREADQMIIDRVNGNQLLIKMTAIQMAT